MAVCNMHVRALLTTFSNMIDSMRMSRKHMGVQLIGVGNKNAVFATLAGPTKRFEVQ